MAPVNGNTEERPCHCMLSACFCVYTACDCEDILIGCTNKGDCLCLRSAGCIAFGAKPLGCGLTTKDDECCKISCMICEYGLVPPKVLCASARQCFCCQSVGSLPFHEDFVNECVCASTGISCAPSCGCCAAPPPSKALQALMAKETPVKTEDPMDR